MIFQAIKHLKPINQTLLKLVFLVILTLCLGANTATVLAVTPDTQAQVENRFGKDSFLVSGCSIDNLSVSDADLTNAEFNKSPTVTSQSDPSKKLIAIGKLKNKKFIESCFTGVIRFLIVVGCILAFFKIAATGLLEFANFPELYKFNKNALEQRVQIQNVVIGLFVLIVLWNIVPIFNTASNRINFLNPPEYNQSTIKKAQEMKEFIKKLDDKSTVNLAKDTLDFYKNNCTDSSESEECKKLKEKVDENKNTTDKIQPYLNNVINSFEYQKDPNNIKTELDKRVSDYLTLCQLPEYTNDQLCSKDNYSLINKRSSEAQTELDSFVNNKISDFTYLNFNNDARNSFVKYFEAVEKNSTDRPGSGIRAKAAITSFVNSKKGVCTQDENFKKLATTNATGKDEAAIYASYEKNLVNYKKECSDGYINMQNKLEAWNYEIIPQNIRCENSKDLLDNPANGFLPKVCQ
jgi:hypothetical protein